VVVRVLHGRYVLGDLIGAGGAAKVFRATDQELCRQVAVKLLDDTVAKSADPAARDRFLHEARSAARFAHPHLVTVFDAGQDDGDLFLVMELVDGQTLAEVIAQRAPLPINEAVSIAAQLLEALATVHALGAIHRDIKPANVLIDDNGWIRLTDFGIAKQLDDIDAAVTTAGMLIGTPHYLAPEQATGRPLSPATDVYQVGLVLNEMLTGQRAGGSNPAAVADADHVDPRRVRGDVPANIAEVVERATRNDPTERFDSATAMLGALTGGSVPMAETLISPRDDGSPPLPIATLAMPASEVAGSAAWRSGSSTETVALPVEPTHASWRADRPAIARRRLWMWTIGVAAVLLVGALALTRPGEDAPAILVPASTTPTVPVSTSPPLITTPAAAPTTPLSPVDENGSNRTGRGNGKGSGKPNKGND
jgi:serine/threonine protein kinase